MKRIFTVLVVFIAFMANGYRAEAQCAMCRSALENNYSNGDPGIAAGLNTGILYLLVVPYLAAMVLGYLWYKSSRNAGKNVSSGAGAG